MKRQLRGSKIIPIKQNQYQFDVEGERSVHISSMFESGNIRLVKQVNQLYYILQAVSDYEPAQAKKSWFYFRVKAARGLRVKLMIKNVNIYDSIYQEGINCKPYYREGENGKWQPVMDSLLTENQDLVLIIEHLFKNDQHVYFCLTVPFTYQDNQIFLEEIKLKLHDSIQYRDEKLTVTPLAKTVHLLTITQKDHSIKEKKSIQIERNKPIVLITARVHPGEVSSSYCLQGILQFLLSPNNLQSYLLRQLFVFKVVPMVNPDGACEGNYRTDSQGHNLNRHYQEPSKQNHSVIYQIVELVKKSMKSQRIQFYFDLHSHSSIKQAFIYGNALDDIAQQTYSQLFCRILQQNYSLFRYSLSNFGQKHMKHKDKGDQLTKQGCGRVVINKICGVIQSYTIQSCVFPFFYSTSLAKGLKNNKNTNFTYFCKQNRVNYSFQNVENNDNEDLIVTQNKKLGKQILVSILDMVNKNPYSRLSEQFNQIFFKQTAAKLLFNQQRFKLYDIKSGSKSKIISKLIKSQIQGRLEKEWIAAGISNVINQINWPTEFRKIVVPSNSSVNMRSLSKIRVKTQSQQIQFSHGLKYNSSHKPKANSKLQSYQNKQQNIPTLPQQIVQIAYPDIHYTLQMKYSSKDTIIKKKTQSSQSIVKTQGNEARPKSIIQYLHDQVRKNTPLDKSIKHNHSSINKMFREQNNPKKSILKSINNPIYNLLVQNGRNKLDEQNLEQQSSGIQLSMSMEKNHCYPFLSRQDAMRSLQQRKIQLSRKRFNINRPKASISRAQRMKVRFPDFKRLNLIMDTNQKDRTYVYNEKSSP